MAFFVTTPSLDAVIPFGKFGMFLIVDQCIGNLNRKRFQERARTGNAGRLHFSAALVIPWTAASPGAKVLGCWKYGHVAANLRKDRDSRHGVAAETGNGAQELEDICKGFTDGGSLAAG